MKPIVAVDLRMVEASGIGAVLQNLMPFLVTEASDWSFRLLGDPERLTQYGWARLPHVTIIPFAAPVYSIAEQKQWPAGEVRGADVVWVPNYNIPLRWNGPLMVTVHDVAHLALPHVFPGLTKRLFAKLMFEAVRRRAATIIFPSNFSREEFSRLVGRPRGIEKVAPNGVDTLWFEIEPGPKLRSRPYLLFVGNVKPHKNLVRLLLAFGQIRERIEHDLLIVGRKDGFITGDKTVLEMIQAFGGRVQFTGYLPDEELRRLFSQADALILPSLYEGFGLPPVEAMAAGCPTLVSEAGSLPEVCGDASLYCNPYDIDSIAAGLVRITTDRQLRQRLREKGARRARELSWNTCRQNYLAALYEIIQLRRGGCQTIPAWGGRGVKSDPPR